MHAHTHLHAPPQPILERLLLAEHGRSKRRSSAQHPSIVDPPVN